MHADCSGQLHPWTADGVRSIVTAPQAPITFPLRPARILTSIHANSYSLHIRLQVRNNAPSAASQAEAVDVAAGEDGGDAQVHRGLAWPSAGAASRRSTSLPPAAGRRSSSRADHFVSDTGALPATTGALHIQPNQPPDIRFVWQHLGAEDGGGADVGHGDRGLHTASSGACTRRSARRLVASSQRQQQQQQQQHSAAVTSLAATGSNGRFSASSNGAAPPDPLSTSNLLAGLLQPALGSAKHYRTGSLHDRNVHLASAGVTRHVSQIASSASSGVTQVPPYHGQLRLAQQYQWIGRAEGDMTAAATAGGDGSLYGIDFDRAEATGRRGLAELGLDIHGIALRPSAAISERAPTQNGAVTQQEDQQQGRASHDMGLEPHNARQMDQHLQQQLQQHGQLNEDMGGWESPAESGLSPSASMPPPPATTQKAVPRRGVDYGPARDPVHSIHQQQQYQQQQAGSRRVSTASASLQDQQHQEQGVVDAATAVSDARSADEAMPLDRVGEDVGGHTVTTEEHVWPGGDAVRTSASAEVVPPDVRSNAALSAEHGQFQHYQHAPHSGHDPAAAACPVELVHEEDVTASVRETLQAEQSNTATRRRKASAGTDASARLPHDEPQDLDQAKLQSTGPAMTDLAAAATAAMLQGAASTAQSAAASAAAAASSAARALGLQQPSSASPPSTNGGQTRMASSYAGAAQGYDTPAQAGSWVQNPAAGGGSGTATTTDFHHSSIEFDNELNDQQAVSTDASRADFHRGALEYDEDLSGRYYSTPQDASATRPKPNQQQQRAHRVDDRGYMQFPQYQQPPPASSYSTSQDDGGYAYGNRASVSPFNPFQPMVQGMQQLAGLARNTAEAAAAVGQGIADVVLAPLTGHGSNRPEGYGGRAGVQSSPFGTASQYQEQQYDTLYGAGTGGRTDDPLAQQGQSSKFRDMVSHQQPQPQQLQPWPASQQQYAQQPRGGDAGRNRYSTGTGGIASSIVASALNTASQAMRQAAAIPEAAASALQPGSGQQTYDSRRHDAPLQMADSDTGLGIDPLSSASSTTPGRGTWVQNPQAGTRYIPIEDGGSRRSFSSLARAQVKGTAASLQNDAAPGAATSTSTSASAPGPSSFNVRGRGIHSSLPPRMRTYTEGVWQHPSMDGFKTRHLDQLDPLFPNNIPVSGHHDEYDHHDPATRLPGTDRAAAAGRPNDVLSVGEVAPPNQKPQVNATAPSEPSSAQRGRRGFSTASSPSSTASRTMHTTAPPAVRVYSEGTWQHPTMDGDTNSSTSSNAALGRADDGHDADPRQHRYSTLYRHDGPPDVRAASESGTRGGQHEFQRTLMDLDHAPRGTGASLASTPQPPPASSYLRRLGSGSGQKHADARGSRDRRDVYYRRRVQAAASSALDLPFTETASGEPDWPEFYRPSDPPSAGPRRYRNPYAAHMDELPVSKSAIIVDPEAVFEEKPSLDTLSVHEGIGRWVQREGASSGDGSRAAAAVSNASVPTSNAALSSAFECGSAVNLPADSGTAAVSSGLRATSSSPLTSNPRDDYGTSSTDTDAIYAYRANEMGDVYGQRELAGGIRGRSGDVGRSSPPVADKAQVIEEHGLPLVRLRQFGYPPATAANGGSSSEKASSAVDPDLEDAPAAASVQQEHRLSAPLPGFSSATGWTEDPVYPVPTTAATSARDQHQATSASASGRIAPDLDVPTDTQIRDMVSRLQTGTDAMDGLVTNGRAIMGAPAPIASSSGPKSTGKPPVGVKWIRVGCWDGTRLIPPSPPPVRADDVAGAVPVESPDLPVASSTMTSKSEAIDAMPSSSLDDADAADHSAVATAGKVLPGAVSSIVDTLPHEAHRDADTVDAEELAAAAAAAIDTEQSAHGRFTPGPTTAFAFPPPASGTAAATEHPHKHGPDFSRAGTAYHQPDGLFDDSVLSSSAGINSTKPGPGINGTEAASPSIGAGGASIGVAKAMDGNNGTGDISNSSFANVDSGDRVLSSLGSSQYAEHDAEVDPLTTAAVTGGAVKAGGDQDSRAAATASIEEAWSEAVGGGTAAAYGARTTTGISDHAPFVAAGYAGSISSTRCPWIASARGSWSSTPGAHETPVTDRDKAGRDAYWSKRYTYSRPVDAKAEAGGASVQGQNQQPWYKIFSPASASYPVQSLHHRQADAGATSSTSTSTADTRSATSASSSSSPFLIDKVPTGAIAIELSKPAVVDAEEPVPQSSTSIAPAGEAVTAGLAASGDRAAPTGLTSCPDCSMRFASTARLHDHQLVKHQGWRFLCPHCDNGYESAQSLKRHLMQKHGASKMTSADAFSPSPPSSNSASPASPSHDHSIHAATSSSFRDTHPSAAAIAAAATKSRCDVCFAKADDGGDPLMHVHFVGGQRHHGDTSHNNMATLCKWCDSAYHRGELELLGWDAVEGEGTTLHHEWRLEHADKDIDNGSSQRVKPGEAAAAQAVGAAIATNEGAVRTGWADLEEPPVGVTAAALAPVAPASSARGRLETIAETDEEAASDADADMAYAEFGHDLPQQSLATSPSVSSVAARAIIGRGVMSAPVSPSSKAAAAKETSGSVLSYKNDEELESSSHPSNHPLPHFGRITGPAVPEVQSAADDDIGTVSAARPVGVGGSDSYFDGSSKHNLYKPQMWKPSASPSSAIDFASASSATARDRALSQPVTSSSAPQPINASPAPVGEPDVEFDIHKYPPPGSFQEHMQYMQQGDAAAAGFTTGWRSGGTEASDGANSGVGVGSGNDERALSSRLGGAQRQHMKGIDRALNAVGDTEASSTFTITDIETVPYSQPFEHDHGDGDAYGIETSAEEQEAAWRDAVRGTSGGSAFSAFPAPRTVTAPKDARDAAIAHEAAISSGDAYGRDPIFTSDLDRYYDSVTTGGDAHYSSSSYPSQAGSSLDGHYDNVIDIETVPFDPKAAAGQSSSSSSSSPYLNDEYGVDDSSTDRDLTGSRSSSDRYSYASSWRNQRDHRRGGGDDRTHTVPIYDVKRSNRDRASSSSPFGYGNHPDQYDSRSTRSASSWNTQRDSDGDSTRQRRSSDWQDMYDSERGLGARAASSRMQGRFAYGNSGSTNPGSPSGSSSAAARTTVRRPRPLTSTSTAREYPYHLSSRSSDGIGGGPTPIDERHHDGFRRYSTSVRVAAPTPARSTLGQPVPSNSNAYVTDLAKDTVANHAAYIRYLTAEEAAEAAGNKLEKRYRDLEKAILHPTAPAASTADAGAEDGAATVRGRSEGASAASPESPIIAVVAEPIHADPSSGRWDIAAAANRAEAMVQSTMGLDTVGSADGAASLRWQYRTLPHPGIDASASTAPLDVSSMQRPDIEQAGTTAPHSAIQTEPAASQQDLVDGVPLHEGGHGTLHQHHMHGPGLDLHISDSSLPSAGGHSAHQQQVINSRAGTGPGGSVPHRHVHAAAPIQSSSSSLAPTSVTAVAGGVYALLMHPRVFGRSVVRMRSTAATGASGGFGEEVLPSSIRLNAQQHQQSESVNAATGTGSGMSEIRSAMDQASRSLQSAERILEQEHRCECGSV